MTVVVSDLDGGPDWVGLVEVEGLAVADRDRMELGLALCVLDVRVDALELPVAVSSADGVGEPVGEREGFDDRVGDAVPDEDREPVVDREGDTVEDEDRRADRVPDGVCAPLDCAVLDSVAVDVLDAETDTVGVRVGRTEKEGFTVTV